MDAEYWRQRWREGRTGWHHAEVMPLLTEHWPALGVRPGARVLVPLCGKSLDMLWLAQLGFDVLGVDVSPIAIETFLAENHLEAHAEKAADGGVFKVTDLPRGGITLVCGDVFALAPARLAACTAFYDRAASIALPRDLRTRFASAVYGKLPAGARGLLITLEYSGGHVEPPPFSIDGEEVQRMFARTWGITALERRDILAHQASFQRDDVASLHTAVYALTRRAS